MNQDVSGDNIAVEQPKNDFTSTEVDQVEAEAVKPAEPKKEEPPEVAEVEADSENDTGDEVKKPRKGGFQKKIQRLEAEVAVLRAQQAPVKTEDQKEPTEQGSKPKSEDFQIWEDYSEAHIDWKIQQREIVQSKKAKETAYQQEYQTKAQRFEAQKSEMRERFPNFDEKLANYDGPTSQIMDMAIVESDMSGEILNYLGDHYEEAEKLAGMSEIAAHKFVAKIEARIESERSKDKPAVKTSKAPPPIKPVGSGKGTGTKDPEEMTGDEYLAYERARLRNKNR